MANWKMENDHHVCSKCGFVAFPMPKDKVGESEIDEYLTPYCPLCGSKMYDPSPTDIKEFLHRDV